MPQFERITLIIESLPGARAQVQVNIPTPTPGMRLETPAHALAIDALGWLGKQPAVAGFVYGGAPETLEQANYLRKWFGPDTEKAARLLEIQHARIQELEQGKCLHQIAEPVLQLDQLHNLLYSAQRFKGEQAKAIGAARLLLSKAMSARHPDDVAVDALAALMKAKLAKQRAKGYGGWDDKAMCSHEFLSALLRRHVDKGDPVDVANFCAFLVARSEGIAAAPQAVHSTQKNLDTQIVDFLAENYLGPDFRWGEPATEVVVIEMPRKQSYRGDFRTDMQAAMNAAKEQSACK